jgi:hypothetical protein
MKSLSEYEFNSRPPSPTNFLLLISDLEGSYQNLKYMGFKDDMDTLNEIKQRYYKLYFKAKKNYVWSIA